MSIFIQAQELYFGPAITGMLDVTRDTIANSISDYESVTETIFVCFILFQALILFFFRQKLIGMMREDIF